MLYEVITAIVKQQAKNWTRNIYSFFGSDPDLTLDENKFDLINRAAVRSKLALATDAETIDLIHFRNNFV